MPDHQDGQEPSVESVFVELRHRLPSISIERLKVAHPADDDNLWFIKGQTTVEVQIGAHPGGRPPFLIEGDSREQRLETSQLEEAVSLILTWLASQ